MKPNQNQYHLAEYHLQKFSPNADREENSPCSLLCYKEVCSSIVGFNKVITSVIKRQGNRYHQHECSKIPEQA